MSDAAIFSLDHLVGVGRYRGDTLGSASVRGIALNGSALVRAIVLTGIPLSRDFTRSGLREEG